MLSSVVKHLCIGVDESTHQHLVNSVDGTVLKGSSDQTTLYQQILEQWPHSIVINSHDQNFSAEWCFRLRSQFAVAEIPLIVILHKEDPDLEEQLSLLPRLSVFHAHEETVDTLTMFVEMLVDEYARDPFMKNNPVCRPFIESVSFGSNNKAYRSPMGDSTILAIGPMVTE